MKIPQATSQHVTAGVLSKQRCVSNLRNCNNSGIKFLQGIERGGKSGYFVRSLSKHNVEYATVYLSSILDYGRSQIKNLMKLFFIRGLALNVSPLPS